MVGGYNASKRRADTSNSNSGIDVRQIQWANPGDGFEYAEWGATFPANQTLFPGESIVASHDFVADPVTSDPYWQQGTIYWFFDRLNGLKGDTSAIKTISATTHVYANGVDIGTVTLEKDVYLYQPYYEYSPTVIDGSYLGTIRGNPAVVSGDSSHPYCINFTGRVATPDLFANYYGDPGTWAYNQLVWPDRTIYGPDGSVCSTLVKSKYVLDSTFPYAPAASAWSAVGGTGNDHTTSDQPASGLNPGGGSFVIVDGYQMHQIYRPPFNGVGSRSEWISLYRIGWTWNTDGSYSISPSPAIAFGNHRDVEPNSATTGVAAKSHVWDDYTSSN